LHYRGKRIISFIVENSTSYCVRAGLVLIGVLL
jgi:hypothetical protein